MVTCTSCRQQEQTTWISSSSAGGQTQSHSQSTCSVLAVYLYKIRILDLSQGRLSMAFLKRVSNATSITILLDYYFALTSTTSTTTSSMPWQSTVCSASRMDVACNLCKAVAAACVQGLSLRCRACTVIAVLADIHDCSSVDCCHTMAS